MASYFYPRPPGGGRRGRTCGRWRTSSYFYPRPPGGGRPSRHRSSCRRVRKFLSTPSGWRATHHQGFFSSSTFNFYPRPPGGGRRASDAEGAKTAAISIHALRVEGDLGRTCHVFVAQSMISIHALRVEGDSIGASCIAKSPRFLSTPSGWRATEDHKVVEAGERNFYPRPPGGGRLRGFCRRLFGLAFLSTPSGWRATS